MANKVDLRFLTEFTQPPDVSLIGDHALLSAILAMGKDEGKPLNAISPKQCDTIVAKVKPLDYEIQPNKYTLHDGLDKLAILIGLELALRKVDTTNIKVYFGYLITLCSSEVLVSLEIYVGIVDRIFSEQMKNLLKAIKRQGLDMYNLVPVDPVHSYHERYAREISILIDEHDDQTVEHVKRPLDIGRDNVISDDRFS